MLCLQCGPVFTIVLTKPNCYIGIETPHYSNATLSFVPLKWFHYCSHPWIKNLIFNEKPRGWRFWIHSLGIYSYLTTSTEWECHAFLNSDFKRLKDEEKENMNPSLRRCSNTTWSLKLEWLLSMQPSTSIALRKPFSSTTNARHFGTWNLVPKLWNSVIIKRWRHSSPLHTSKGYKVQGESWLFNAFCKAWTCSFQRPNPSMSSWLLNHGGWVGTNSKHSFFQNIPSFKIYFCVKYFHSLFCFLYTDLQICTIV